jgi:hypothetical protein
VSHYNFYTQSLNGVAYNSIHYRQTQYDLWPLEDKLQNKKVLLIGNDKSKNQNSFDIKTIKGVYNGTWIEHVHFYPKVSFTPIDFLEIWHAAEEKIVSFKIKNPYLKPVSFNQKKFKQHAKIQYGYLLNGDLISVTSVTVPFDYLNAGESKLIDIKIKAPQKMGSYKLFLSIKTEPFTGTRNSKMITLKVK